MNLDDATLLKTDAFIDGEWVSADGGGTTPIVNPANGDRSTATAGRRNKASVAAAGASAT